ncbi:mo-dependent nitrogenase [Leptolyngbya sp. Heron Island J]|uniref:Mo-dependent nitrogenase C-terminal domain-containing protein n=1 Tax=Leptolyngbya sp. Heron Island J TaxID=1385935 RepID=UPI0003B9F584|nr:Mo-dependent nitrogenase C-terminal domain-containing protein [Leptolyngbya sp. Heron Island J]ESA32384.1 mo-dependent nitrogenase [Leptolyngbya sp. Heron Island J]
MSSATAFLKNHVFHGVKFQFQPLQPIRRWIDALEVNDPRLAHRIARFVPAQCPFERDVVLFGRTVAHIPPMCKLNPLYDEVVGLRFRALCFLADECGEDISAWI